MSRRHFGPQHLKNGYAGMGSALGRPYYSGATQRTVADAIAAARRTAAREAAARKKK
jgi:hypothetical protein